MPVSQLLVDLAAAWNKTQDCGFALHDALIEAGYPLVAERHRRCLLENSHEGTCDCVSAILKLTKFDSLSLDEMEANRGEWNGAMDNRVPTTY